MITIAICQQMNEQTKTPQFHSSQILYSKQVTVHCFIIKEVRNRQVKWAEIKIVYPKLIHSNCHIKAPKWTQ